MSITPAQGRRFEVTAPVVIVGGGACGLTAALAARDEGMTPLVLERDAACLGSSSMSLGALCAAGTADQRRHVDDDDGDTFFQDILRKTDGSADPVLAQAVAEASGPALDWLVDRHDVALVFDAGWRPAFGHTRARMHATPQRSGADLMTRLAAACDRAGVDVVTHARVERLFAEDDGRVTGVALRRPDGSVDEIGCEALVLATCGFGGNAAMIAEHIPLMREARYFGWEHNRGEGIVWGSALGAATADMDAYQGLGLLADPQSIDVNPRFLIEGGVQVNALGLRFSDELDDVSGQGARVIAQPGGYSWVVYDARIHAACAGLPQYIALLDLNARKDGDSVAALAQAIGTPHEALAATLAEVAAARLAGAPDRFGRRFDTPPLAPPYHALRVTGALFHTQGGLAVDARAQVLRGDGTRLPNLFAGGGTARGVSGAGPSGYLPGAGLCSAITLGRLAGRAAAALVKGG